MSERVTGIAVSRNQDEEQQLQTQGFLKTACSQKPDSAGNALQLWIKKQRDEPPITRIQVSYNDEMARGLSQAGYTKDSVIYTAEGPVWFWYFCGTSSNDIPIANLEFSYTPEDEVKWMKDGWEKVGCNVSPFYGYSLYYWIKREKPVYICDVTVTNSYDKDADLFRDGYIRFDDPTNTLYSGFKSTNFLWYRLTTDAKDAISDLKISTNPDEFQQYHLQGYTRIDANLNEGTGGRTVFLYYKNPMQLSSSCTVSSMALITHKFILPDFQEAGIQVIEKNINENNCGAERYLCFLKNNK